jgi:hypothetical protein
MRMVYRTIGLTAMQAQITTPNASLSILDAGVGSTSNQVISTAVYTYDTNVPTQYPYATMTAIANAILPI